MSIRTEELDIAVSEADAASNVYGFVARPAAANPATFPVRASIRYEGEATVRRVVVRDGVPYQGTRLMERVRLAAPGGAGAVELTVGDEPGDRYSL